MFFESAIWGYAHECKKICGPQTNLNNWATFVNSSSPGSTTVCDFTISAGPTCVTATAGGSWRNRSFTSQSGTFTAEFDATPLAAPTDAVVGLSQGAQTSYSGFATLARFNRGAFVNTSATGSSRVCNFMINGGLAGVPTRHDRKFERKNPTRSSLLARAYPRMNHTQK